MAGYPLERHPRLHAHYRKLRERPAFAAQVLTPGLAGLLARAYGGYRRLRGTTLGKMLATAS